MQKTRQHRGNSVKREGGLDGHCVSSVSLRRFVIVHAAGAGGGDQWRIAPEMGRRTVTRCQKGEEREGREWFDVHLVGEKWKEGKRWSTRSGLSQD